MLLTVMFFIRFIIAVHHAPRHPTLPSLAHRATERELGMHRWRRADALRRGRREKSSSTSSPRFSHKCHSCPRCSRQAPRISPPAIVTCSRACNSSTTRSVVGVAAPKTPSPTCTSSPSRKAAASLPHRSLPMLQSRSPQQHSQRPYQESGAAAEIANV